MKDYDTKIFGRK